VYRPNSEVLNSSVLWDIMLHSPLKVNQHFGGTWILPPSSGWKSSVCYLLHAGVFLGIFFDPEDGVLSVEKTEHFIVTAVRSSFIEVYVLMVTVRYKT
jgi:hypothetical protein